MIESKLYTLMISKIAEKYDTEVDNVTLKGTKVLASKDELSNINCPIVTYYQYYQVIYDVDDDGDTVRAKDQFFAFRKNKVYDAPAKNYRPEIDGDESYALVDDTNTEVLLDQKNATIDWTKDLDDVDADQSALFKYWLKEWSAIQCDNGLSMDLSVEGLVRIWNVTNESIEDVYNKDRYEGTKIVFAGRNTHPDLDETATRLYSADVKMIEKDGVCSVLIRPNTESEDVRGRL